MKLKIALEDKIYDKRLVDRLVAEGKVTQKELDEYLSRLDDDSSKLEYIEDTFQE
jgi:hypothetical protein